MRCGNLSKTERLLGPTKPTQWMEGMEALIDHQAVARPLFFFARLWQVWVSLRFCLDGRAMLKTQQLEDSLLCRWTVKCDVGVQVLKRSRRLTRSWRRSRLSQLSQLSRLSRSPGLRKELLVAILLSTSWVCEVMVQRFLNLMHIECVS